MYIEDMENENREFVVKEQLKKERKDIKSFDDLVAFLQRVKDNCNTGYGTAPRAIAQAALATAWFLSSDFGITGFQASFVMWDFIRDWLYSGNECGMKIMDYDDKTTKTTLKAKNTSLTWKTYGIAPVLWTITYVSKICRCSRY